MTWHQWQVEYPIDRNTGLPRRRASSNASSPQGLQSTGLCACCRRYGLVSWISRLVCLCEASGPSGADGIRRKDKAESTRALDGGDLLHHFVQLGRAVEADRERVDAVEPDRVGDRPVALVAELVFTEDLHPDHAFARRLHLPEDADDGGGVGVHQDPVGVHPGLIDVDPGCGG